MSRHKPVFIGRYTILCNTVHVYMDPDDQSSHAEFGWTDGPFIVIQIGILGLKWSQVVGSALHEFMEVGLRLNKNCLEPVCGLTRNDTGRFRFFMDHDQFTEVVSEVGDVLTFLLPDLSKAYNKETKGSKR